MKSQAPVQEGTSTRFSPGKSGNPGGRPSIAKALEACGTTTTAVLARLCRIALDCLDADPDVDLTESPGKIRKAIRSGRVNTEYAHAWLTNHIIGKPKESLDLHVSDVSADQQALLEALRMTPHQRRAALAQDTTQPEPIAVDEDSDALGD